MTDERIQEIAAQAYLDGLNGNNTAIIAQAIRQAITEALTAERSKNAKLREEVLEEAALACEEYRSTQVMSKYARMSECQAARNAAEQCGKILRAMKEKNER